MKRFLCILLAVMCLMAGVATAESVVTTPGVILPGWSSMTIAADSVNVETCFRNHEKNAGWYDLTFEFWAALPEEAILEGTETQVITSTDEEIGEEKQVLYAKLLLTDAVKPGEYLKEAVIAQPVPAGEYDAFVLIQPYYASSGEPTGNNGMLRFTLCVVKADAQSK